MRTRALIVALAAVALGGCGGEPTLSRGSADELRAQVAAVRTAADAGDREKALAALDALAARVRDLEAGGSLAGADAAALERGIARARRKVREEVAAPAPAATPEPTATPEPAATPEPTATPAPREPRRGGDDDDEEGDD